MRRDSSDHISPAAVSEGIAPLSTARRSVSTVLKRSHSLDELELTKALLSETYELDLLQTSISCHCH
jgi:hypothetical protein